MLPFLIFGLFTCQTRATSLQILQTNSKLRRAPLTKHKSIVEISITAKACDNKVVGEINSSGPGDSESVSSQGCGLLKVEANGNNCSSDNVKAIISKPKCNRRRSYTSSLVAKSEVGCVVYHLISFYYSYSLCYNTYYDICQIMGDFVESAKFIKKDDSIDDSTNPLEVVEYVDDIYHYYWAMEVILIP